MIVPVILFQYEIFDHDRFLLQMTVGSIPHAKDHAVARAVRHRRRTRGAEGDGEAAGAELSLSA